MNKKNIEDFFIRNKECPVEIIDCIKLKDDYFKAYDALISTNCLECDVAFLKASFIAKLKATESNKFNHTSKKKSSTKNILTTSKMLTFSKAQNALIYIHDNKIIITKSNKLTIVYDIVFKINFIDYIALIYRNNTNRIRFVLFNIQTKKELLSFFIK